MTQTSTQTFKRNNNGLSNNLGVCDSLRVCGRVCLHIGACDPRGVKQMTDYQLMLTVAVVALVIAVKLWILIKL